MRARESMGEQELKFEDELTTDSVNVSAVSGC